MAVKDITKQIKSKAPSKILFLDRDGTLIKHIPYLCDETKVELENGAIEALLIAQSIGFKLVIVSNQSAIGRGICTKNQVEKVNQRMCELFASGKVFFEEILVCPHHPQERCDCRKPKIGLVRHFNLSENPQILKVMIGDQASDMDFGVQIDAIPILYGSGRQHDLSTGKFKAIPSWREIGDFLYEIGT